MSHLTDDQLVEAVTDIMTKGYDCNEAYRLFALGDIDYKRLPVAKFRAILAAGTKYGIDVEKRRRYLGLNAKCGYCFKFWKEDAGGGNSCYNKKVGECPLSPCNRFLHLPIKDIMKIVEDGYYNEGEQND